MKRSELTEQFAETIIDGMDMEGLIDYATSKFVEYCDTLSEDDLLAMVEESADHLLD